jgi:hypothetical protein
MDTYAQLHTQADVGCCGRTKHVDRSKGRLHGSIIVPEVRNNETISWLLLAPVHWHKSRRNRAAVPVHPVVRDSIIAILFPIITATTEMLWFHSTPT